MNPRSGVVTTELVSPAAFGGQTDDRAPSRADLDEDDRREAALPAARDRLRAGALCFLVVVASCGGNQPGGAQPGGGGTTKSFGADLTAEPNVASTCSQAAQNSCTFYSGGAGPSLYAPATGTVTAVRVRTAAGTPTGPMQILVLRSLYQNKAGDPGHPYFACCFLETYGPTFTPTAGTITIVPTSLPMVVDPTPPPEDTTTNARGDFLALSILAPNVPIPALTDTGSAWTLYAPAPTSGNPPAPSPNGLTNVNNGGIGVHLMMNADINF